MFALTPLASTIPHVGPRSSLLAAAVASLAFTACGHCHSLEGHSSVDGQVTYATEDGLTFADPAPEFWGASNGGLLLHAKLGDRAVRIVFAGLAEGTSRPLAHDDNAKACLIIQSDTPPTCLLLDGTIEVRQLRHEHCEGNANITTCDEHVDVEIHASSHDLGLSFAIDAHVSSSHDWQASECSAD